MDFDIEAVRWDNERREKRAKVIAEEIARVIELDKDVSALEFGCGTGLVSFALYDRLKDITCMDTSKGMIETLKVKIEQHKVKNMAAYQSDIHDASLLLPKYDLIYTSMAMHHVLDIKRTLSNLYCLLKVDGYICIVDLDEDDGSFHQSEKDFNGHNGFSQNKLMKLLEKIGFEELDSYTFYHDKKTIEAESVNYSLFIMCGKKMKH